MVAGESWNRSGGWSWLDASSEPNPTSEIEAPSGIIFIDVITLQAQPSDHTLLMTMEGAEGGNPSAPGTPQAGALPVPADTLPATVSVPTTASGTVGALRPGPSAEGRGVDPPTRRVRMRLGAADVSRAADVSFLADVSFVADVSFLADVSRAAQARPVAFGSGWRCPPLTIGTGASSQPGVACALR